MQRVALSMVRGFASAALSVFGACPLIRSPTENLLVVTNNSEFRISGLNWCHGKCQLFRLKSHRFSIVGGHSTLSDKPSSLLAPAWCEKKIALAFLAA